MHACIKRHSTQATLSEYWKKHVVIKKVHISIRVMIHIHISALLLLYNDWYGTTRHKLSEKSTNFHTSNFRNDSLTNAANKYYFAHEQPKCNPHTTNEHVDDSFAIIYVLRMRKHHTRNLWQECSRKNKKDSSKFELQHLHTGSLNCTWCEKKCCDIQMFTLQNHIISIYKCNEQNGMPTSTILFYITFKSRHHS